MEFSHITPVLKIGDLFSSFEEFEGKLEQYKQHNYVDFRIRDARTIGGASKRIPRAQKMRQQLKYYQVRYQCVYSGSYNKRKEALMDRKEVRKSTTCKRGCKSFIYLKGSDDGQHLVIAKMSEDHNHEVSKFLFENAANRQRKLPAGVKEEIIELMKRKVNRRFIQFKVHKDTRETVSLEYLATIAAEVKSKAKKESKLKLKSLEQSNLESVVGDLESKYNCTVHLCIDEDKNLMGVFLQDTGMKQSFQAFPELMCISSTRKLLDLQIPILILLVEDGNGHNEIVAIGLLISEHEDTFNWFFDTFKIFNPATDETKVILCDKDFLRRSVIREVFPKACVRCDLFHVLKEFNHDLTGDRVAVTVAEKIVCKKLFEKLCFASDEEEYEKLYEELRNEVPDQIFSYFDANWHPSREEWSSAYASFFGGFLNMTSNRLEGFNRKMRSFITSFASLEEFITKLFVVLDGYRSDRDAHIARRVHRFPLGMSEDEKSYHDILTPYAFKFLQEQWELSAQENAENNPKDSFIMTENNCGCTFWYSMYLPCQHIFTYRRKLGMSLYDESLCSERWTRSYCYQSHRILPEVSSSNMDVTSASINEDCDEPSRDIIEDDSFPIENLEVVSHHREKLEKATNMLSKVRTLLMESPDFEFERKMEILDDLIHMWGKGQTIVIKAKNKYCGSPPPRKRKRRSPSYCPILPKLPPCSQLVFVVPQGNVAEAPPPVAAHFMDDPVNRKDLYHLKDEPVDVSDAESLDSEGELSSVHNMSDDEYLPFHSDFVDPPKRAPIIERIVSRDAATLAIPANESATSSSGAANESAASSSRAANQDFSLVGESIFSAAKFSAPPHKVKSFLSAQEKLKNATGKFERMELMMTAFSDMLSFFS